MLLSERMINYKKKHVICIFLKRDSRLSLHTGADLVAIPASWEQDTQAKIDQSRSKHAQMLTACSQYKVYKAR